MGIYDITGWSGGGRRPINYGLKAGQFRGMGRVNVFPSSTTIVNNNIIGGGGCYSNSYDCGCNNGGSNKFMNWMMGIGLGSTLLGGILSMFGIGGGQKTEGAGGKEEKAEVKKEETPKEPSKLDQARKTLDSLGMTKDNGYTVSVDEDGKITYHYNKDGIDVEADNVTDLIDKINKAKNKDNNTATPLDEVDETVETPPETPEDIQTPGSGNKPNTTTRTGTGSPAGWYRQANDAQTNITNSKFNFRDTNLKGQQNLDQLVYDILESKGLENKLTPENKAKLRADIIKKNPSVFNPDGTVKKNANWDKLDIPSANYIGKTYYDLGAAKTTRISGANGYTAERDSDGKTKFYDKTGKSVPEETFKKVCPNIYQQINSQNKQASSQSAPPPSGNAQHVLTNGQKVNISGAKVGKNPKANASQKDTFFLQTSDGQKINISRMDYINIQKKIES